LGLASAGLKLSANGTVQLLRRIVSNVHISFNYLDYPFDSQRIKIEFSTFTNPVQNVIFHPVERPELFFKLNSSSVKDPYHESDGLFDFGILNFFVTSKNGFPVAVYDLFLKRVPTFYFLNLMLPLILLIVSSHIAYFLDPMKPTPLKLTSRYLEATMYFFVSIYIYTPPVYYLTRIILFILVSFLFSCISLIAMIFTYKFIKLYNVVAKAGGGKKKDKGKKDKSKKDKDDTKKDSTKNDEDVEMMEVEQLEMERVDNVKIFKSFFDSRLYLNRAEKGIVVKFLNNFVIWYKYIACGLYFIFVILLFTLPAGSVNV
jgi:hypothetical protein